MQLVNILPVFIVMISALLNQAYADIGQQTFSTAKNYIRTEAFYSIPNLKILSAPGFFAKAKMDPSDFSSEK